MNKIKFLETLRKKLSVLEESEIEDILNEYDGYIEEKMATGCTEEEAVKSMGNINELAKDLLSAYKVKPEEEKKDVVNNLLDKCMMTLEKLIDFFSHKSFKELLRFIIELICIFIIIALCNIPFYILKTMGDHIFLSLGDYGHFVFYHIWEFALEIIYFVFAILLFIKIFEKRYLNQEDYAMYAEKKEKKDKLNQAEKKVKIAPVKTEHEKNFSIIDFLVSICIVFLILIGVSFYVVGMAFVLALIIYLLFQRVFYFGIYLTMIALFILGLIVFIFLFNFLFNRKTKISRLLVVTLSSFVLLGIGMGISAIEFANTTIYYESNTSETFSYEFDMSEQLVLSDMTSSFATIKIDDTVEDKIYVEYKVPNEMIKIEPDLVLDTEDGFQILRTRYRTLRFEYSKTYFDKIIANLRNKTLNAQSLDDVTITLTMNSKVKKQLDENRKKLTQQRNKERDLEEICEELKERNYSLPSYCKSYTNQSM